MSARTAASFLACAWALAPAAGTAPVLGYEGYGAVRFGMSIAEAERALGTAGPDRPARGGPAGLPLQHLQGLLPARYMVEDGHITRVELDAGDATSSASPWA